MKVDASSDDDVNAVIDKAIATYNRLDVFFANAGVAGPHPFLTQTKKNFLKMMIINVWSVFAAVKYASIAMQKTSEWKPNSGGSIIATASVGGVRAGGGPMSYSASKAAVINICQNAGWRLHGKNIRVNAICPGLINTEMIRTVFNILKDNKELKNSLMKTNALERDGKPEEVTALATFLAGPGESFVTGQDIKVDGGCTAALPYSSFFAET